MVERVPLGVDGATLAGAEAADGAAAGWTLPLRIIARKTDACCIMKLYLANALMHSTVMMVATARPTPHGQMKNQSTRPNASGTRTLIDAPLSLSNIGCVALVYLSSNSRQ